MTDYPPTEYDDWQRARGHMSGTVPLRTLAQARADLALGWGMPALTTALLTRRITEDEFCALVKMRTGK
ncbi:MAG: hypothetical protein Dbin4_02621 [Alphaproteobacteria bacterium]|nr:hypothetical protein [Alphaproteobacteria bacterium]